MPDLAASIGLGAQRPALSVPHTQFTLPNGLNVILHRDTSVPVVALNLWYHVGSGHERVGRTGFAHLFEHVMFEGSMHVPEGSFDSWLEAAGANNNGSTTVDRTNYYIDLPSNALDLALFLESDRMGFLLDDKAPDKINGQRDVVKNEKRQSVDNQPYGQAFIELPAMLYPAGHPYSWSTIGSMEDLTAASFEDVARFFRTYYVPNNASLVIAGDIDIDATRKLVEKWFSEIPRGKPVPALAPPTPVLDGVKRKTITDRVQLPRLYMAWHTPPFMKPGDAALDIVANLLAGGKNSRLYRRLVYDLQIAQDVSAFQQSQALGSNFIVITTARPGQSLDKLQAVIDEELDKLRATPPEAREMTRALNQIRSQFLSRHGARGRLQRQGRPVELVLHGHPQPRLFRTGSGALPRRDRGRCQGRRRSVPAEGSPRRAERRSGRKEVKHALDRAAGRSALPLCSCRGHGGGAEAGPRQAARHRARAVAQAAGHPETEAVERPRGVDRRASRGAARAGQPDRAFGQRRGSDRQVRRRQPRRRHARRRRRFAIVARPRRRARVPRRQPHDDELVRLFGGAALGAGRRSSAMRCR